MPDVTPGSQPAAVPPEQSSRRHRLIVLLLLLIAAILLLNFAFDLRLWARPAQLLRTIGIELPGTDLADLTATPEGAAPAPVLPANTVGAPSSKHSDWIGYSDPQTGFQIIYPAADPTKVASPRDEQVRLKPAAGSKERFLRIEQLPGGDPRIDDKGCLVSPNTIGERVAKKIGDVDFCINVAQAAAAGTTVRNYYYTAFHLRQDYAVFTFEIRYPTDVRAVAGCGGTDDLAKTECVEAAFDESRDAGIFSEIADTIVHIESAMIR